MSENETPASITAAQEKSVERPAKRPKAVVLMSGGLDSTLAARILQEQGVEVVGVHFSTGFCVSDHKRATASVEEDPRKLRNEALRAGADLKIPVRMVDLSEDYLEVVFNPKHGYGAHMNPCIDCRTHMLKKAKALMEEEGADFVATGEVLGQRPMSQRKDPMRVIQRESGLGDRLLRPLSAQLLEATAPERQGMVDRSKLLSIRGRGRRVQMDLVEARGITDYPSPAGGCCFLTDENYTRKFRDKMTHRGKERMGWEDVALLKVGRHFRISPTLKLVLGRREEENLFLERFTAGRVRLEAVAVKGPVAVTDESLPSEAEEALCAAIVARYSDGREQDAVEIRASGGDRGERIRRVAPLLDETILAPMRL
ncbi:MAG: thiamine biosynthesis protein [Acidobacteriota bacterium]